MNRFITTIHHLIKQIRKKGFFHLLSANILIQIFAFASQLFVAGILSPEDIGRIKVIQTYLSIFSIVAAMGFSSSTLKICSETDKQADHAKYFNAAFLFTLISTILVYAVILMINHFGIISSDKLIKALIPIGLFPIITSSIFTLHISYFQAIKEVKLFSKLTVINKIISIVGIIIFSYYWGIKGYYYAYNLSLIVLVFVAAYIIRKKIGSYSFNFDVKYMFKEHWKYSKTSQLSNIISEVSSYIDILLISFLVHDLKEIGYYSFALTACIALRIVPSTVQQITIPYFSSFSKSKEKFIKVFKRYNILLHLIVIVILILFVIFVPPFISFVFKGKYDPSIQYLIILAFGWSLRHVNLLQGGAIFGLGKISYNAKISFLTLVGNLIIYPIAIHYWGLMGAAFASIPNGLIVWIFSNYYYRKAIKTTDWEE